MPDARCVEYREQLRFLSMVYIFLRVIFPLIASNPEIGTVVIRMLLELVQPAA